MAIWLSRLFYIQLHIDTLKVVGAQAGQTHFWLRISCGGVDSDIEVSEVNVVLAHECTMEVLPILVFHAGVVSLDEFNPFLD